MTSDHGLIKAVFQALSAERGPVAKVFYTVPPAEKPPYVVVELSALTVGNGLPSPHFQARGTLILRVWSACEGMGELSILLGKVSQFFKDKRLPLLPGEVWFEVVSVHNAVPSKEHKHPWREGKVELQFWLQK